MEFIQTGQNSAYQAELPSLIGRATDMHHYVAGWRPCIYKHIKGKIYETCIRT